MISLSTQCMGIFSFIFLLLNITAHLLDASCNLFSFIVQFCLVMSGTHILVTAITLLFEINRASHYSKRKREKANQQNRKIDIRTDIRHGKMIYCGIVCGTHWGAELEHRSRAPRTWKGASWVLSCGYSCRRPETRGVLEFDPQHYKNRLLQGGDGLWLTLQDRNPSLAQRL